VLVIQKANSTRTAIVITNLRRFRADRGFFRNQTTANYTPPLHLRIRTEGVEGISTSKSDFGPLRPALHLYRNPASKWSVFREAGKQRRMGSDGARVICRISKWTFSGVVNKSSKGALGS